MRMIMVGILGVGLCMGVVSCSTVDEALCDDGVCTLEKAVTPKIEAAAPRFLWATSSIWTKAPELEVAKWLTEEPDMEGKFVLIEFWRTWCGACKRNTALLNKLQETYADDLVVIAITGESESVVKNYTGPDKKYFQALDKPQRHRPAAEEVYADLEADPDGPDLVSSRDSEQGAYESYFGVFGWPHAILLEPEQRSIVWEGFPALKGHELSVEKVGKYIEIGKAHK